MFSLCDVAVKIECETPSQVLKLISLCQRLFRVDFESSPDPASTIHIRLKARGNHEYQPVGGQGGSQSTNVVVHKTQEGFKLRCGMSALDFDASSSRAEGELDEEFWRLPPRAQKDFFLLAFLTLLGRHGRFALHSEAVVNDGAGYLIVGRSGAGKTTLAMALVQEGWDYLSDEAIMLDGRQGGIAALAFQRGFSCAPAMVAQFPRLVASGVWKGCPKDRKSLVDIEPLFPGQFTPRCRPKVLLFPEIVHTDRSSLAPMDETTTLISLIRQCPFATTNRPTASEQLDVLNRLVRQTTSYRLLAGTDVYENPKAVSQLLREAQRK